MVKCKYCGREYSDSILPIHKKRCPKNPANVTKEPSEKELLKARADELGLEYGTRVTIEQLKELIANAENEAAEKDKEGE